MAKLAADLEGNRMDDLASMGRFGDTMVAHINPQEAQMLMQEGGSGTINPMTGLPEFYFDDPGFMGGGAEGDIGEQGIDFSGQDFADTTSLDPSDPTGLSVEAGEPFTEEQLATAGSFNKKFDNAIEVARNRPNINETSQDFITRLANSIEGKTQSPDGQNIGLTQDEIASLGFYTDNPDDPRFGSYLGYNDLVDVNAFQSKDEENFRLDIAYTDRLNQEFKDKGLDARIAPDPNMKDNYVYTGPDATQAFLGELGSGIFNTVAGFGSMMLDASSMSGTGILMGMLTGSNMLAPQFFEGKSIPSPGAALGKTIGLVNEEGKAPLEDFVNSITSSIKSGLGIGTDKQVEQTVLKNNPDEITVNKAGELVSVSKDGEERNLSGVLTPAQVTESVLGGKPPTDAEFKAMTSGGSPSEYDLMFGKNTSLLGPFAAENANQMRVGSVRTSDGTTQVAFLGERGRSGDIIDYEKAMGGLGKEPSLDVLEELLFVDSYGKEVTGIRGAPQITAQENVMRAGPVTDIDNLNFLDLDAARIAEAKDIREGMGSGMPGPRSIGSTSPVYPAFADLAKARAETNLSSTATTPSTAFVDQPNRFDDPGGNEPIVRRKPKSVVSQAIDEAVEEDKPYFPEARLPRLTESGLKTLQYTLRNDPEALQNIYNKYALPEQYSGLKALV